MSTKNKYALCLLLGSASHPSIDCVLEGLSIGPHTQPDKKYTLEACVYQSFFGEHDVLKLSETNVEPDAKTAASQALLFACWRGDYDSCVYIVRNLREIIDINMLLKDQSILAWALKPKPNDYTDVSAQSKACICRFLIVEYGSKLNANRSEDDIAVACAYYSTSTEHDHTDIVAYLAITYGSDLACGQNMKDVFECLVMDEYEEDAKAYLLLYTDLSADDFNSILIPTGILASLPMFNFIIDTFQSRIDAGRVSELFRSLCYTDNALYYEDKIRVIYNTWAHHLTPEIIEECLTGIWRTMACRDAKVKENRSRKAHTIIEVCMTLICDRGIEIAMAQRYICPNIQLLDTLIDRNLEQIRNQPELARHALLVCVSRKEIEIFEHLLARIGPSISADALEFWCRAGDLEAAVMILDVGADNEGLIARLPMILKRACCQGDEDMVELLISHSDSIKGSDYVLAFYGACRHGHEGVIRILINLCGHHLSFHSNTDYEIDMTTIDPDTIHLLNETFGTTVDPTLGSRVASQGDLTEDQGYLVAYKGWPSKTYFLC